ncbi:MAG: hypothetical protein U0234_01970 [Sandaracinus sp.]
MSGRRPGLVLASWLALAGCGGATPAPESATPAAARAVSGHVSFGARLPTPAGLTATEVLRPARYVEVRLLGAGDAVVATAHTDATGAYAIEGAGSALEIVAHAEHDGLSIETTHDAGGQRDHTFRVPLSAPAAEPVDVTIRDAESEMAGALHIVDTLLGGLEAVQRWVGVTLPSVYVYWGRGVTTDWSYYRGEVPEGSGRFCLELLGGQPGQQASTDTDEHDEAIILHELGHFVMDRISGDSSIGGMHPRGVLVDPGLAWEEGRATWFATAVLGDPSYRDTIGIVGMGSTRVDENLETPQPPRGLGSETSVAGILWDLSDGGAYGLPDVDGDGVAIGPAAVLLAMRDQALEPGTFASSSSFLRFLVRTQRASPTELAAMLATTGEPATLLPADDVSLWPIDVSVGASAHGEVDGLTDPAPSGGTARPENGFDAVRAFRVHVAERGMLDVQMIIDGTGGPADRTDLDLELRDLRAHVLDRTVGASPRQAVVDLVEPGDYLAYVRDAGSGNRARFELHVALTPVAGP